MESESEHEESGSEEEEGEDEESGGEDAAGEEESMRECDRSVTFCVDISSAELCMQFVRPQPTSSAACERGEATACTLTR